MGYFQNEEHFLNYLKKVVRESGELVELLPWQFYIDYIYRAGRAESFTWAIKNNGLGCLEEPGIWNWLRSIGPSNNRERFTHQLTDEFLEVLDGLRGVPGVYSFHSESEVALYVGRSSNLCSRMMGSFARFQPYDKPIYARYIPTRTASDAVILEGYFIALLCPALNGADNFQDGITLTVLPIPEWSERVRCNWIIHERE
jgi:hypothetical protein